MNTFFWYPKCSTCKKAEAFIKKEKMAYQERLIKEERPTEEEITSWIDKYGIELKKLWNTSGLLYREKKLKEELPKMTQKEQIALLASDGMLVKRPLFIGEDFLLIGFKEKEWREKLCPKN